MKRGIPAAAARCAVVATLVIGLMPTIACADAGDASSPTHGSGTKTSAPETPPDETSENQAEGTWGTAAWTIDAAGTLAVGEGVGASANGSSPWADYAPIITAVAFEGTVAPANSSGLLAGLNRAVSIDLSGLDTSASTNLSALLSGCNALTTVDLSGLDTSRAESLAGMFENCGSLAALDLSSFNTAHATNFTSMFSGCSTLTSLDISGFDASRAASMSSMFSGCNALSQVTVGKAFSFKGSSSTVKTELPSSRVNGRSDWYSTNEEAWFDADEIAASHNNVFTQYRKDYSAPLVDPSEPAGPDDPSQEAASGTIGTCPWSLDEKGALVIESGALPDISSQTTLPWASYASRVKSVSFDGQVAAGRTLVGLFKDLSFATSINLKGLDTSKATSLASLFSGCRSLQSVDLSPLDGSNAADLSDMFRGCSSLRSIDLAGFNTARVTSTANMFYGCAMLKSFDLAALDLRSNATLSGMFANCTALESVSFSGADLSRVTRMDALFSGCSSLAGIDFADADLSRVTRMDSLFSGCSSLAVVNASAINTQSVTTMERMFSNCTNLLSLDLSALDTSRVTNMAGMFDTCSSLHSLKLGFDTSRVTSMASMFNTCQYLTELDLASFDTGRVTDMTDMFSHCTYLQHLDISGFDTGKAASMSGMFDGCSMLSCVKVGSGFSFAGTADAPQCELPSASWAWGTSDWYSTSDGDWLSADTIAWSSSGKATTYQKGTTAPAIRPFPVSGERYTFSDVDYMAWYGPAVCYVTNREIIKGYGDSGVFGVNDTMTRAQFAVILHRLFEGEGDEPYPANATDLSDIEDHAWYTEAANWAVENGIIMGIGSEDGSTRFGPDEPLEFQQMIVIVSRCAKATLPADTTALDRFEDGEFVASWAQSAMAWAVEEGLVSGYGGSELRSAEHVTRERASAIIMNCCLLGYLA